MNLNLNLVSSELSKLSLLLATLAPLHLGGAPTQLGDGMSMPYNGKSSRSPQKFVTQIESVENVLQLGKAGQVFWWSYVLVFTIENVVSLESGVLISDWLRN